MVRNWRKFILWACMAVMLGACNASWVPLDVDRSLGEQSNEQIKALGNEFKLVEESDAPYAYERLHEIRDLILASGKVTHAQDFPWELHIVKDDSVQNAFCLPGGYIYVYTGLIRYLDSEAALAGVLGHEMAHADLRHSTNQMVKNTGLSLLLSWIFGTDGSGLLNIGANLLSLSFSRTDESAADKNSVIYLYETPYDPRGAAVFFEKLEKSGKLNEAGIAFLNTHPNPENRIKEIHEVWKQMGGRKGKENIGDYQKIVEDLP